MLQNTIVIDRFCSKEVLAYCRQCEKIILFVNTVLHRSPDEFFFEIKKVLIQHFTFKTSRDYYLTVKIQNDYENVIIYYFCPNACVNFTKNLCRRKQLSVFLSTLLRTILVWFNTSPVDIYDENNETCCCCKSCPNEIHSRTNFSDKKLGYFTELKKLLIQYYHVVDTLR